MTAAEAVAPVDVRLVQVAYGDSEPIAERVDRVAYLVRAQRGADLVVLPELWAPGGFSYDAWTEAAEALDGPTVAALGRAAADAGVVLHGGSIIERDPATGALYNTSVVFDRSGQLAASYRKIHRFGFSDGEPKLLQPGDVLGNHDLFLAGRSVPVGLTTCYDLRFPELFRMLTHNGMEMAVVVAAWPAARVEHWRLLARARAVENQVTVIACNTAGTHAGTPMGGHSMVIDPLGVVLAEAGEGEEVLRATVDPAQAREARVRFPVLLDRRL